MQNKTLHVTIFPSKFGGLESMTIKELTLYRTVQSCLQNNLLDEKLISQTVFLSGFKKTDNLKF